MTATIKQMLKLSAPQKLFLSAVLAGGNKGYESPSGGSRKAVTDISAWHRTCESLVKKGLVTLKMNGAGRYAYAYASESYKRFMENTRPVFPVEIHPPSKYSSPTPLGFRQVLVFLKEWYQPGSVPKARPVPLAEKPTKVWTLFKELDEIAPPKLPIFPTHRQNAFAEDYVHDWNWRNGMLDFSSRVADGPVWVLCEYAVHL